VHLTKMEELQKLVNDLEEEQHELERRSSELYNKLEEAKDKLALEQQKDIETDIPYYTKKLERMKIYIDGFRQEYRGDVRYAFEKQDEPYKGDFHEIIQDPLEYAMCEYDCLGMTKFLEIVFDYHNESVRTFVTKWMEKNVECAEPYSDSKQLYNRHFSKK
jgi:hypothetical protein